MKVYLIYKLLLFTQVKMTILQIFMKMRILLATPNRMNIHTHHRARSTTWKIADLRHDLTHEAALRDNS